MFFIEKEKPTKNTTIQRVPKEKKTKRTRSEDLPFLKAIGQHCQKLRNKKGYSIDRLAKESERLSTSVIHRLETGTRPVNILTLYKYAEALKIHPKTLLDIQLPESPSLEVADRDEVSPKLILSDDPRVEKEAFKSLLPVYSLRAAAGYFGAGEDVVPEGWLKAKYPGGLDKKMFIARSVGHSMLPKIRHEDLLVFRSSPTGSRQGKIVLVQYRGPEDPETGGSYTIKRYRSSKTVSPDGSWEHRQITLEPLNPDYESIILFPKDEHDFRIIAEYLFTLDQ